MASAGDDAFETHLGGLPPGPSDLLLPPGGAVEAADDDEVPPLSAAEMSSVLRRANHALARARIGPHAAPAPHASRRLSASSAPPAAAVEAERRRVESCRSLFPERGLPPTTPAYSMPLSARATPSGTWGHQEAARRRPRPASARTARLEGAAAPQAALARRLVPAPHPATALARDASARARATAHQPRGAVDESRSTLPGPDPWWERLNAAQTGEVLLSESEVARATSIGRVPPAVPLESRHDVPSSGCWIRLSEQHAAGARPAGPLAGAAGAAPPPPPPPPPGAGLGQAVGYRSAERAQARAAAKPRTFGTSARASPSGTWPHQKAAGDYATQRAAAEAREAGKRPHAHGSFLPLRPVDNLRDAREGGGGRGASAAGMSGLELRGVGGAAGGHGAHTPR